MFHVVYWIVQNPASDFCVFRNADIIELQLQAGMLPILAYMILTHCIYF